MRQLGVGNIEIGPQERKNISQVLKTGRLSYGEFTKRFEQKFATRHQVKHAIFCNSGTSALQVALNALKIKHAYKDGDEVIVPALTFVASVNVILQNNLKPVFVDVEPDFFGIDPKKIEAALTPKTRAIMPVHVGGQPCQMDQIMQIARKYKLQVIEDSCETVDATFKNKKVGSFGDIACFSTYVAHTLTTGVGGFIVTNDKKLAELSKSLCNHGRDNIYLSIDDDKNKKGKALSDVVSKRFNFEHVGYSYRATEFEAAIGVAQMQKLGQNIARRKQIAKQLTKGLMGADLFLPHKRPEAEHTFMFYPIVAHDREKLVNYLEEHGIETRYLLPLTNQPVYKGLVNENRFPIAKMLNKKAFYIGCHPGLSNTDVKYIISTFRKFFR